MKNIVVLFSIICITFLASTVLVACGDDEAGDGGMPDAMAVQPDAPMPPLALDDQLQELIQAEQLVPLPDKPNVDAAKVALGQALYFDKEISGNRDIACATCHYPGFSSGDGLSLSIGTGGVGVGPTRTLGNGRSLVPRNAPEVFNRGYDEWTSMFWDSRVSGSQANGFTTPAGADLPANIESVLAAQAVFPPTARGEMRGNIGDLDVNGNANELADFADDAAVEIWTGIMARLIAIPEYVTMFDAAYPGVSPANLDFGHVANAIAAFEVDAFTFTDSPWDRYLRGDTTAMSDAAKRGALTFFGPAGCSKCHSGVLFTDQEHHVVAVPQLGPGTEPGGDDFGRFNVTGNDEDKYAFRTPPLRNVTLTGPWFHSGAYTTLRGAVEHYLSVGLAARTYEPSQLDPIFEPTYYDDDAAIEDRISRLDPDIMDPLPIPPPAFLDLLEFLGALTDPAAADLSATIPATVPSGLPVD